MPSASTRRELLRLTLMAAAVIGLHLIVVNNYGIFRDELYYLACGRHLAWGYVDHPPVVALMARVGSWLGGSLVAIRLLPIALSGAVVFLVAAIARHLGGGWFAQALAAGVVSLAPHMVQGSGFRVQFSCYSVRRIGEA
jgi:4-amino-4-deoxy-L-arabinose transferase-like glycosyltransferase